MPTRMSGIKFLNRIIQFLEEVTLGETETGWWLPMAGVGVQGLATNSHRERRGWSKAPQNWIGVRAA